MDHSSAAPLQYPAKRPPKIKQACDCCHARKIRCDGETPCSNCRTIELICTYLAVPKKKGPKGTRVVRDGAKEGKRVKRLRIIQKNPDLQILVQNSGPFMRRSQESEGTSPPKSPPKSDEEDFSFNQSPLVSDIMMRSCVDAFFTHKYPIMPILDTHHVTTILSQPKSSPENYALITALCAIIVQQPEIIQTPPIIQHPIQQIPNTELPTSEYFIKESVRARQFCNYIDSPSLATIHTSFFLFAALFGLGKDNSAWFYIRESITILQLLRLHEETTYANLADQSYATYCRRTFWLLFITERAYALQRHRPLTLQRTITLPAVSMGTEATIISGFLDLVSLFQNVDDDFLNLWNLSTTTTDSLASPQSLVQLQYILKFAIPNASERTKIQQADLLISRQWLKTMVWQLCVTKGLLSSTSANEAMSFQYPVMISRDLVLVSRTLPPKALEANGIGILEKIFDVGCSLADVLQLHPNHINLSGMEIGPRDYLMEMVRILAMGKGSFSAQTGVSGGNGSERFLRVLAGKANECLNVRISRGSLSGINDSRCIEEIEDNEGIGEGESIRGDWTEVARYDADQQQWLRQSNTTWSR